MNSKIPEAELTSDSDHREQLTILVTSGKAKEMIDIPLTKDQVKGFPKNTSKGTRPYSKKTLVKLSLTLFSSSHVRHRQVSSPLIDEGGGDLMKESF